MVLRVPSGLLLIVQVVILRKLIVIVIGVRRLTRNRLMILIKGHVLLLLFRRTSRLMLKVVRLRRSGLILLIPVVRNFGPRFLMR